MKTIYQASDREQTNAAIDAGFRAVAVERAEQRMDRAMAAYDRASATGRGLGRAWAEVQAAADAVAVAARGPS